MPNWPCATSPFRCPAARPWSPLRSGANADPAGAAARIIAFWKSAPAPAIRPACCRCSAARWSVSTVSSVWRRRPAPGSNISHIANVNLVWGDGFDVSPALGLFDRILVHGALEAPPPPGISGRLGAGRRPGRRAQARRRRANYSATAAPPTIASRRRLSAPAGRKFCCMASFAARLTSFRKVTTGKTRIKVTTPSILMNFRSS